MKPPPFEYHAAESVEEAVGLLAEHGDEAKVLAGGQSLVPLLAFRLARPAHLIDINGVGDLGLRRQRLRSGTIGALVRHRVAERSEVVRRANPLFADALGLIGHVAIRNRGTVGGSMAHADPAAELPTVLVALDGEVEVRSGRGTRAGRGAATSSRGSSPPPSHADELLTAVRCPAWAAGTGWSFQEFSRRSGDFAVAGRRSPCGSTARHDRRGEDRPLRGVGHARAGHRGREARWPVSARPPTRGPRRPRRPRPGSIRRRTSTARRPTAATWSESLAAPGAGEKPRPASGGAIVSRQMLRLTVNGKEREALVEARKTLADFLREDLELTGTHIGCEHGVCGACTVLRRTVLAVRSCLMLAVQAGGRRRSPRSRGSSTTGSCTRSRRRSATATASSAASARRAS